MSGANRRRLAVLLGGMAGTAARAAASELLDPEAIGWPWGTFAVNVGGAALLGYLLTRWLDAAGRGSLRVATICVGALGALTTFSALAVQLRHLVDAGRVELATTYALASLTVGLTAALAGTRLAEIAALAHPRPSRRSSEP